jgi:hypothetical protein
MLIFLQVDTAVTAAGTVSNILTDRSDAMVILVAVLGILALWVWKVLIPQKASDQKLREADKEIHQANAATLAKLSEVTAGIHATTQHSNTTLRAIIEVEELKLDIVGKVAEAAGCDVRTELGKCHGVLIAVRAGATVE